MIDKKILLHTCCAPCLTSSKERLDDEHIESVIFWYNPNIEPKEEHDKRLHTLCEYLNADKGSIHTICDYDYEAENKLWHEYIKGLENEPERGQRCRKCIEFRLKRTAEKAKILGIDFATTLTVSPHKNSKEIFETGAKITENSSVKFFEIDFKKKDGYKRSIEICKELGLYRQSYCGCSYSER